jgi:hypothetical protein
MIVMITLPILGRASILLAEVAGLYTLEGNFCSVFFRVMDVLAIVPEACRNGDALHLDSARPGSTTACHRTTVQSVRTKMKMKRDEIKKIKASAAAPLE